MNTLFLVEIILNFLMPRRFTNSQSEMCHETVFVRTVPVRRSWFCPNRIPCFDTARLGAFIADPA